MNDPALPADSAISPLSAPTSPLPSAPMPAPPRPAVLTVFAILNIVLSGIALLGLPFSVLMFYFPTGQSAWLMGDMVRDMPAYAAWMRIILPPGAIFAGLQLYAGIRLLKGRESTRKLAILCALYGLLAGGVMGYLNITYMMPYSMSHAMKQFPNGAADEVLKNPAFNQMMQASAFMGILVGLLPPLATLFFLSRKNVRDYCQQQSR